MADDAAALRQLIRTSKQLSTEACEPLDAVTGVLGSDAVGEIIASADVTGLDPTTGVQDAIGGEASDAVDDLGD